MIAAAVRPHWSHHHDVGMLRTLKRGNNNMVVVIMQSHRRQGERCWKQVPHGADGDRLWCCLL